MESWRDIDLTNGYYQVSDFGRVRRVYGYDFKTRKYKKLEVPQIVKPSLIKQRGFQMVNIYHKQKNAPVIVGHLVTAAFMPKPQTNKNLILININGDKTDNRLVNLKWVEKGKRASIYEKHTKTAIIKDYQDGMAFDDIYKKYNTNRSAVDRLLKRENVARLRIYDNSLYSNRQQLLNEREVKEIIKDYENGMFADEIAEKHKIKKSYFMGVKTKTNTVIRYVWKYRYIYLDYEEMFIDGLTNKEIAEIVGCSYNLVSKRRRQWENGFFEHLKEKQRKREQKFNN